MIASIKKSGVRILDEKPLESPVLPTAELYFSQPTRSQVLESLDFNANAGNLASECGTAVSMSNGELGVGVEDNSQLLNLNTSFASQLPPKQANLDEVELRNPWVYGQLYKKKAEYNMSILRRCLSQWRGLALCYMIAPELIFYWTWNHDSTSDFCSSSKPHTVNVTSASCKVTSPELPPVLHLSNQLEAVTFPDGMSSAISTNPDIVTNLETSLQSSSPENSSSSLPVYVEKTQANSVPNVEEKSPKHGMAISKGNKSHCKDGGLLNLCANRWNSKAKFSELLQCKKLELHQARTTDKNLDVIVVHSTKESGVRRACQMGREILQQTILPRSSRLYWSRTPNPRFSFKIDINRRLFDEKVMTVCSHLLGYGLLMSHSPKNKALMIRSDQLKGSKITEMDSKGKPMPPVGTQREIERRNRSLNEYDENSSIRWIWYRCKYRNKMLFLEKFNTCR